MDLRQSIIDTLREWGSAVRLELVADVVRTQDVEACRVHDALDVLVYDEGYIESYWAAYENDHEVWLRNG